MNLPPLTKNGFFGGCSQRPEKIAKGLFAKGDEGKAPRDAGAMLQFQFHLIQLLQWFLYCFYWRRDTGGSGVSKTTPCYGLDNFGALVRTPIYPKYRLTALA